MVFYRKYRPQTISELDNQNVRETLFAVLEKGNNHAYLFTGPKGLGKTSAARIVAKVLNCQRLASSRSAFSSKEKKTKDQRSKTNDQIEPCNTCDQCMSITNGTNMDVLEIDGASNRGIDEIRGLREAIRLLPVSAAKKVYIIDEVHMLTTEAFNALLKTLEEPPEHAVFILCTTESHKVPATILSRCLHIPFTLATAGELIRSLSRIVKAEKIQIKEEVLSFIASLSEGSFRDGAKLLEEIATLAKGKEITRELVEGHYSISGMQTWVSDVIESLSKKDAKQSILLVGKIVKQGASIEYCIERIMDKLHEMLLQEVGVKPKSDETLHFSLSDIKKLFFLLSEAKREIRYAVLPQLPLELVVVEWCLGEEKVSNDPVSLKPVPPKSERRINSQESVKTEELLQKLINIVKTRNHSSAGLLRSCNIKKFDEQELTLETAYKFHKDRLEEKEIKTMIEDAVSEISGKKVKVSVILKGKKPA